MTMLIGALRNKDTCNLKISLLTLKEDQFLVPATISNISSISYEKALSP